MGALWQVLVIFGVHWGIVAVTTADLAALGYDPILGLSCMVCYAQIGVVLAIIRQTKDKKLKETATGAFFSGLFGVTEPAIYGVTLPNGKQFLLTCVGSAIAGALASILGVSSYTMAGMGLFQIPGQINPANPGGSLIIALIVTVIATVIGFVIAFLTYKDAETKEIETKSNTVKVEKEVLASPVKGKVVPLNKVEDAAFSEGALGKGIAVEPTEGKVVAPCDGTIMTLFPTKHAIGIVSDNGCEILIHIGMDTVQLEGKYFDAHVKQGDKVKKGDVLVTFDMDAIKNEGYSLVTPVIITNTADYLDVVEVANGNVSMGDDLLTVLN